MASPVFRFAPSPNGFLHVGHAYSAFINADMSTQTGGTFLLRVEDIDAARCTPAFEAAIADDLRWLGLTWPTPVRRQSEHLADYVRAQRSLESRGLIYPCFCTRGDIARATDGRQNWPRDPDGAPLYPGTCRALPDHVRAARRTHEPHAWRLDMAAAVAATGDLCWTEWSIDGAHDVRVDALAWGDVIVARKDIGTSYHVAVVVDDALQDVTHVVRGRDLFAATAVHRVLQTLLGLTAPLYRHHRLLHDADGDKLAKSKGAPALRTLREAGATPHDVREMLGFR